MEHTPAQGNDRTNGCMMTASYAMKGSELLINPESVNI